MSQLTISDLDEVLLEELRRQAADHNRTLEAEAGAILASVLQHSRLDPWEQVDAIRDRLAARGRCFSDSAELVRLDRDR